MPTPRFFIVLAAALALGPTLGCSDDEAPESSPRPAAAPAQTAAASDREGSCTGTFEANLSGGIEMDIDWPRAGGAGFFRERAMVILGEPGEGHVSTRRSVRLRIDDLSPGQTGELAAALSLNHPEPWGLEDANISTAAREAGAAPDDILNQGSGDLGCIVTIRENVRFRETRRGDQYRVIGAGTCTRPMRANLGSGPEITVDGSFMFTACLSDI